MRFDDLSRHHLCRYNFHFWISFFFWRAMLLTHLKKKAKRGGFVEAYCISNIPEFRWRKPSHPCIHIYLSFEWQPQNLIVHTSVCKFFVFSPPLSLHNARLECNAVCYSTMQHCCSRQHTHTHSIRQSVCFVTIAGSFVRAIKRVSCSFLFFFIFLDFDSQTIQSCVFGCI